MEKKYISTRNQQKEINFYQAIVQGIGEDGGLLVPDFDFTKMDLDVLSKLNYVDLATEVLSTFVPEEGKELIHDACLNAYGKGLFPEIVVPVKKAGDVYVAELFPWTNGSIQGYGIIVTTLFNDVIFKTIKRGT